MTRPRSILLAAVAIAGVIGVLVLRQAGIVLHPAAGINDTRVNDHPEAAAWAKPLTLSGVPNLHRVCEDLYRGAQPTAEGMEQLHQSGIKTIVNLRSAHSDRDEIGQLPLGYEHIAMTTWHPEDKDVVRFLQIVTDEDRPPVFVHCQRGADRTGTMCAIYRIAIQGWTCEQAIAEMTQGGFAFYEGWQNLADYVRELDIDAIKTEAGLVSD